MSKITLLVVGGFAVVLVLPVFNNLWTTLADTFIAIFGITADSPTGVTFYMWVRAMPYIVIGVVAILAFRIIRGGGGDSPEV
jgi:drug/metabolite transporter (DMT)-like permease